MKKAMSVACQTIQLKILEIAKSPGFSKPGEAGVTDSHITKDSHGGTNRLKASGRHSREAA